jgi:hypothetical protein
MRYRGILLVALLVVVTAFATGCDTIVKQGVENATGVKVDGNNITVNKDGKTVQVGGAESGKLPDGFPSDFPMFSPLTITGGMKVADGGVTKYTVTANATGVLSEVRSFYSSKLAAAGWAVKEQGSSTGETGVVGLVCTKRANKANVQMVAQGPSSKVQIIIGLDVAQ